jgi:primosomal protein N' (replication factor Y)
VSVAIDAVGAAGARPFTYVVPPELNDLEPGEAVVVPFGRRRALGIVLGPAEGIPPGELRSVSDRVRADGPLLPPASLALARRVAAHYLAPPALVLRSFLPPALLERLELVAEAVPAGRPADLTADDARLLDTLAERPVPVRRLRTGEGRAAVLRRLRALETAGLVHLDWTLSGAGAGPRYVRWARIEAAGRAATEPDARPGGRRLGERSRAALLDLAAAADVGIDAPTLTGRHGSAALAALVRRGLVGLEVRATERDPLAGRAPSPRAARPAGSDLTADQAAALAAVEEALAGIDGRPILLTGAAGAGKTAVYREAIGRCLDRGRQALVLVPEVAHALVLADRLRADLDATVVVVHSGLSDGERGDAWRRIRRGVAKVVVGTRIAIGSPLADPGLVIVDEEHDGAFKSDRTPRLQARDMAVALGGMAGAAVVLGSATPAVATEGRARSSEYRRVELADRAVGGRPAVDVVDLRRELAEGHRAILSRPLIDALTALDTGAGEQAILVINRRGAASVVLCRDCGSVQACLECGRPLVFHQAGMTLRCHHCGAASPLAVRCPACRSPRIRYLGGGTQRVERDVRDSFPHLRVGRLDRDVAERRGAADRVIEAFAGGALDVLVGTSLVAKALDIPAVTLVAVVSADIALNLPDERATERTYQLLAQAIGRAGRGDRPGRAIIQTYQPDHPVIAAVRSGEAAVFYDSELETRRRFGSPPFGRLVKLTVALPERTAALEAATAEVELLRERASERRSAIQVAGPLPSFVPRRAGRWRYNVVLRGADPVGLLDGGLAAPWSVDVDPDSLL